MDWDDHPGRGDRQVGQGLHRGEGLGPDLPGLRRRRLGPVRLLRHQPDPRQEQADLDAQTVAIPGDSLGGGYDARIAGPNPWTLGPLGPKAPGYLKGQSANEADRAGVASVGGVLHAYTDSSHQRRRVRHRGQGVQQRRQRHRRRPVRADPVPPAPGARAGRSARSRACRSTTPPPRRCTPTTSTATTTRTSPATCSACPASSRRRARTRSTPASTWSSAPATASTADDEGRSRSRASNAVPGERLHHRRRQGGDRRRERRQVRRRRRPTPGVNGGEALPAAAGRAAPGRTASSASTAPRRRDHLPYRTADGGYDPAPGIDGKAESLHRRPTSTRTRPWPT